MFKRMSTYEWIKANLASADPEMLEQIAELLRANLGNVDLVLLSSQMKGTGLTIAQAVELQTGIPQGQFISRKPTPDHELVTVTPKSNGKYKVELNGDMAQQFNETQPGDEDDYWDMIEEWEKF